MKILWYEIRKATDSIAKGKIRNGWSLTSFWTLPDSTFELFFKYYRKNIDIYWCIREIAQTVGKGWLLLKNSNWDVIENDEVKSAFDRNGWFDMLKRSIIRNISVCWNAFLLIQTSANGTFYWIQSLDPRTIRIVVNVYGEPMKYIQETSWVRQEFKPEQILHCYNELDPDNEIFWFSPMEWIITDVLAENESALTNYYYFKNNAIPSQLIVLEEWMKEDEQENTIDQLKRDFGWGWKNKHKIAVLNGIKDIKTMQDSFKDMDFEVLRKFTTNKVCTAYSVPKTILWYTDWVNYTNADTQYFKFIENTVVPREEKIAIWINQILNKFQSIWEIIVEFDSDHINDFDKRVDIKIKQLQYWLITPNEARQELWYEPYIWIDTADRPLISKSLDLLEDAWLSDMPIDNGWT